MIDESDDVEWNDRHVLQEKICINKIIKSNGKVEMNQDQE
jgi:hypothetical protein